jgi:translation initiation factor eIF-2B subunit alpha
MPGATAAIDSFDVVTTYSNLLREDPDLTMPVAAIESLVIALAHNPTSTITETLEYLKSLTDQLIASTPNPISLSAGTDLFQRYLIASLRPGAGTMGGDFQQVRLNLLNSGRQFAERAKAARDQIAAYGTHFIRDGCTVLTSGGSRVVGALLNSAAEANGGSVRFKVIYVLPSATSSQGKEPEGLRIVQNLRRRGVPVATIPEGAVGYAMGKVDMVIVGAEGVVENGGVISRLGTYQLAMLAKVTTKPFYVVAEAHKFVRLFPLGQYDLPIEQRIIDFKTESDEQKDVEGGEDGYFAKTISGSNGVSDAVDFTPPAYISGIITGMCFYSPRQ